MNIYLDIDGVLLANEYTLSKGAVDLIKYIADNFTVYWLTTHCMHGDGSRAIEYVNRAADEDLTYWLKKFKPTTWSLKKTDAIDFSEPFFWLDDDCFSSEQSVLNENQVFNSWIEVDLKKYPDQLVHELRLLISIFKTSST